MANITAGADTDGSAGESVTTSTPTLDMVPDMSTTRPASVRLNAVK
jgi:hypothetical protein